MTQREIETALETLIDASSLVDVLAGLEEIATLKAMHIEENWQDVATAAPWWKAQRRLETTRRLIDQLGI